MKPRAWWHPWLMMGPTVLVLFSFFVLPVGIAIYQSFFSWDLLTPPRWVGFENYVGLSRSGELMTITLTTLRYSVMVVVGSMGLGLGLALLLSRPGRLFAAARSAIFSAYVVSWVSVALLWMWLLDPDSGIIAGGLRLLGLSRVGFLTDPTTALATLAGVTIWKITGYSMILFVVGLQEIHPSLHEAAALDGAGPVSRFWYITLPLLRPTMAFIATTSLIVSFQAFDVVRVMTQGGPAKATTLFVYAIYEQVFLDLRVGQASALTVVFLGVLLLLSLLQLWAFQGRGGRR